MSEQPHRQPAGPTSSGGSASPRVPRGVPTGGQFAPSAHAEADLALEGPLTGHLDRVAADANAPAMATLLAAVADRGTVPERTLRDLTAADVAEIQHDLLARIEARLTGRTAAPVDRPVGHTADCSPGCFAEHAAAPAGHTADCSPGCFAEHGTAQ